MAMSPSPARTVRPPELPRPERRPRVAPCPVAPAVVATTAAALLGAAAVLQCQALDNGVGRTPALGWSSWNFFEKDINESVARDAADALVRTGLIAAGYRFVNLDAGVWLPNRSADGRLVADPAKFPSGLPALASYLRDRKITLGLYTDLSSRSAGMVCGTGPGSFGSYAQDAATIASVAGFVKVDYCAYDQHDPSRFHPPIPDQATYWAEFRDAFNRTGKAVYLYFCPRSFVDSRSPPVYDGPPREWSGALRKGLANALLTEYHNAQDSWESAMSNLDALLDLGNLTWSGPGFWQDADMLQVCNYGRGRTPGGGMQTHEYAAVFTTWAVLASTLVVSPDVGALERDHPDCLDLLRNPRILAVNQDRAGHAPFVVRSDGEGKGGQPTQQVFGRRLQDGGAATVLLNRGATTAEMTVWWSDLGLAAGSEGCHVVDLFSGDAVTAGVTKSGYAATVGSHSAAAVSVRCGRRWRTGRVLQKPTADK